MWKNGKLFDQLAVPSSKQTPRQASAPFVKTEPTNVTSPRQPSYRNIACTPSNTTKTTRKQRSHRPSCTSTPPRPSGPSLVAGLELLATKHQFAVADQRPFSSLSALCALSMPFSPRPSSTGLLVTKMVTGSPLSLKHTSWCSRESLP
ncbi:uncharacterized protein ZBAI_09489 [Zygosaccharomyces bailii ISA1307]|nr:uncharacterized protein ZBAI_09489 [Zygosaccharomyces bailii ISA1307]